VTHRFITNLAAQEKVAIAQEHVDLAREVAEAVQARMRAGVGSPLEEGNAVVHLRELEIALAAAEMELRRSWGLLAAAWGAPPDGIGKAAGDLYALSLLPPFAVFAERLERNPQIARFAAARAGAEAEARLARAGRTPDITVSAGVRRLEVQNEQARYQAKQVPWKPHCFSTEMVG
jgi:cobalt-zinc-cadmium efflux system outer membrane protein